MITIHTTLVILNDLSPYKPPNASGKLLQLKVPSARGLRLLN